MMMMSFFSSSTTSSARSSLQQPQKRPRRQQRRYRYLFSIFVFILLFLSAVINYIELSPSSSSSIDYFRYLRTSKSTTSKEQQQTQRRPTKIKIAICITGMPERLQPWHMLKNLIAPNINSNFDMHIVFALSEHTQLKYSSRPDATFEPSPYAKYKTPDELKLAIIEEGKTKYDIDFNENSPEKSRSVQLDVLPFISDLSKQQWLDYFQVVGNNKLDRITQYDDNEGTQINILNMYNHQVICGKHIEEIEKQQKFQKFDYIINTREDAHYFKNIHLNRLVTYTMTTMTTQTQDNDNNINENDNSSNCDLITKDCLDFGGINMRFQFINGRLGIKLLTERLDFYKRMYNNNNNHNHNNQNQEDDNDIDDVDDDDKSKKEATTTKTASSSSSSSSIPSYIQNPEQFELQQLYDSNGNVCKLPISIIPINVGRHTTNGDICFLPYEIDQCVPLEYVKYVNNKKCYNFHWKPK